MKHTPISHIPFPLPEDVARLSEGAPLYDSSSSPEARVYYIDRNGGYYLKVAAAGALQKEAVMTDYLHALNLSARVLSYRTEGEHDLLLTERLCGEDATHPRYLCEPERLCDTMAYALRALHELPTDGCPIRTRTADYLQSVDEGYRLGRVDPSMLSKKDGITDADAAYRIVCEGKGALRHEVLLHGDYCLPNIMLLDFRPCGFIDLGCGGVGDRHIDLFWGAWTLCYNLGTDRYRERFFDAYGRDLVDPDRLRTVRAAEVFG